MDRTLKEIVRMNLKPNYAALGRMYGCDYRTAKKKYLNVLNEENNVVTEKKKRKKKVEEFEEIIKSKLNTIEGVSAKSIYMFLKLEKKYKGSYSSVRDYIRKNRNNTKKVATIRVEPEIGRVAQVDWKEDFTLKNRNGEEITFNLFLIRLTYSRKFYTILTLDKKRDVVKNCIIESLQYFGGVPKEIWFDNMATVVDIGENGKKKVNVEIDKLAKDMGFKAILCRTFRPQSKGCVENLAKLTQRLEVYNNEFETLEELIEIVKKFNEECGKEVSEAHNHIVDEEYLKEKEYLLPLPQEKLMNSYVKEIEPRKVTKDSMITYKGNKYSVPTKYINQYLNIRIENNQVYIYDSINLIRCHQISEKKFNYFKEDKIEILQTDLWKGKSEEDILEIANNSNLSVYDSLKTS